MTWVATAIALVAAATSAYNTHDTARKADNVAAQGIRTQAQNQRSANQRLGKTIDDIGKSDASSAKKSIGKQYLDHAQASMGKANAGLVRKGLSSDFNDRAGGAAAANEDYASLTANLLARMDAPLQQRQAESNVMGNTGMDLGVIGSKIQGDAFLNQMQMNGVRRNPYIDAAAQMANAYAKGYTPANGNTGVVNPNTSVAANGSSNLYQGAWGA